MYAGNDKTFNGVLMSLLCTIKYHKDPLNVIILSMDLTEVKDVYKIFTEEHRKILEIELKKVNKDSVVKVVDVKKYYEEGLANNKNEESSYTPYTLVRLLADKVPDMPDKVIYLDYDAMPYNDIKMLWDIDVEHYEFAGVKDYYGKVFINRKYINAGVLLLNLKEIKKTGLFEKCLEMIMTKKMLLPDQSALNKKAVAKKIIDTKFNEQHKLTNDTVIRHFSAIIKFFPWVRKYNIKPWNLEKLHNELKCHEFDDIIEVWQQIAEKN